VASFLGELPPLFRKDELARHTPKSADVRLETRVIELERERAEDESRHREALAALHQKAAEELAIALKEQKERLEKEYAGSIQTAVAFFEQAQTRYFAEAEAAVIRLALSIAARVLHREAQLDPLLLRGAVRVALENAQQNATCVLEVDVERAEAWERWLSGNGTPARVQVRSREDAAPGHCRLEIGASSADLSVDTQLAEIERGFFDLMQSRPALRGGDAERER
jgi:flagellar assembly protein FliH